MEVMQAARSPAFAKRLYNLVESEKSRHSKIKANDQTALGPWGWHILHHCERSWVLQGQSWGTSENLDLIQILSHDLCFSTRTPVHDPMDRKNIRIYSDISHVHIHMVSLLALANLQELPYYVCMNSNALTNICMCTYISYL